MDDPLLVRLFQCFRNLGGDIESLVDGDGSTRDALGERLARDKLENKVVRPLVPLETVNRGDVGMVQRREKLRLPLEPGKPLLVLGELFWKNFNGDVASELGVPSTVDLAHTTRTDEGNDLVRTEPCSGFLGHVSFRRRPEVSF